MRRLLIVTLVALVGLLPALVSRSAYAQSQPATQSAVEGYSHKNRLLAAGAGAILGILFFNIVTQPFGTLPWVSAGLAPAPKDVVVGSRIIAALVGGGGAIAAHFLYHATHD